MRIPWRVAAFILETMARSYEKRIVIPADVNAVWQRAQEVLATVPGAGAIGGTPGVLSASIKLNWLSYGENVTIGVAEVPDGTGVRVRSECSFPLQAFDWGKNKKNVEQILRGIELPGSYYPDS